ncbi:sigma-70 family RNA polymerase sigma factor [Leucobacter ruminantium]|uniref:Sigma-70 family RNA polymerase sigma factor n=1 Tax=Leucobacter ruminantium TaxID=1289170 RepID=A0A939LX37_9MICO|nr:sigma-70 family RNA polymerase sigma factor [Leucobacter ruminantium]MBO1806036.1 sigma-70 family RNA polymerase sigma factor [Leucobacter ruminantium]
MSDAVLHLPDHAVPASPELSGLDDGVLCDMVRGHSRSESGRAAFGVLYSRYRDQALAQALSMTRNRAVAEDLVQETFTRVLKALANGKGPTDSVLGYVLISLRSEAIRTCHTGGDTVTVAPDVLAELFDEPVPDFSEALSEEDQIGRAYALLPEDARRVLWLLDVEQVPADVAGEHLGMQVNAVRVHAHRARRKLAAAYLQQYVEDTLPGCAEVAGMLAEHVRGELRQRATAKVEQHLTGCVHCTAQVTRLRDLSGVLRAWAAPVLAGAGLASGTALAGGHATPAVAATLTAGHDAAGHGAAGHGAAGHGAAGHGAAGHETAGGVEGVPVGKLAGWVALVVGVALLVGGAFALFPRDATGAPPTPATDAVTQPGTTMPDSETVFPDADVPGTDDPGPGTGTDPQPGDGPALPDGEKTVSPDDTTPGWKLRD